jgi:hypothetical protein
VTHVVKRSMLILNGWSTVHHALAMNLLRHRRRLAYPARRRRALFTGSTGGMLGRSSRLARMANLERGQRADQMLKFEHLALVSRPPFAPRPDVSREDWIARHQRGELRMVKRRVRMDATEDGQMKLRLHSPFLRVGLDQRVEDRGVVAPFDDRRFL